MFTLSELVLSVIEGVEVRQMGHYKKGLSQFYLI
jgi:hypothetical protein